MVDKTKTIKSATPKELTQILYRLQAESEAQTLLGDIERKSTSKPANYKGISTEEPIELTTDTGIKTITIKTATDEELTELLSRLRKESQIQSTIQDLRNKSLPNANEPYPTWDAESMRGIDRDTPIDTLYHYGILGMRWGIRRSAKALARVQSKNLDRSISQFTPYVKTGIRTRDGRMIMSPDEVQNRITELQNIKSRMNGKPVQELKPVQVRQHNPEPKGLSDDYMRAEILKTQDYRTMSNAEISALNQRLQLEKSYRTLKTEDRQKGLETVRNVTKVVATIGGLYALSKTPMIQDLTKAVGKKVVKDAAKETAKEAVKEAAKEAVKEAVS